MPNLHLKLLGGQHRVWALKTLADDEENKTLQVRSLLRASCHHSRLFFSSFSFGRSLAVRSAVYVLRQARESGMGEYELGT